MVEQTKQATKSMNIGGGTYTRIIVLLYESLIPLQEVKNIDNKLIRFDVAAASAHARTAKPDSLGGLTAEIDDRLVLLIQDKTKGTLGTEFATQYDLIRKHIETLRSRYETLQKEFDVIRQRQDNIRSTLAKLPDEERSKNEALGRDVEELTHATKEYQKHAREYNGEHMHTRSSLDYLLTSLSKHVVVEKSEAQQTPGLGAGGG